MRRIQYVALGSVFFSVVVALGLLELSSGDLLDQKGFALAFVVFVVGPLLILAEVVGEVIFGGIGVLALRILTLGKVRMEREGDHLEHRWKSIGKGADGRRVLSAEIVSIFGLLVVVVGVGLGVWIGSLASG